MVTRGVVRDWNGDQGWGVIDSPQTPGGCWVHDLQVAITTQNGLRPGQDVAFTYEQDGYDYRARRAWRWGEQPARRPGVTVLNDHSGAFTSSLTLTFDATAAEAAGTPPVATMHSSPPQVLGTVTVSVYESVPGSNEVRIHSLGTLDEDLVDWAIAELEVVRRGLLGT